MRFISSETTAPPRGCATVTDKTVRRGRAPRGATTTNHADSISLLFLDRSGSVHAARLKQQGRRFPLFIFEMLTSTRRLRVSAFWVALTQRTHSQRAIGVIPFHRSWIFGGRLTN